MDMFVTDQDEDPFHNMKLNQLVEEIHSNDVPNLGRLFKENGGVELQGKKIKKKKTAGNQP